MQPPSLERRALEQAERTLAGSRQPDTHASAAAIALAPPVPSRTPRLEGRTTAWVSFPRTSDPPKNSTLSAAFFDRRPLERWSARAHDASRCHRCPQGSKVHEREQSLPDWPDCDCPIESDCKAFSFTASSAIAGPYAGGQKDKASPAARAIDAGRGGDQVRAAMAAGFEKRVHRSASSSARRADPCRNARQPERSDDALWMIRRELGPGPI